MQKKIDALDPSLSKDTQGRLGFLVFQSDLKDKYTSALESAVAVGSVKNRIDALVKRLAGVNEKSAKARNELLAEYAAQLVKMRQAKDDVEKIDRTEEETKAATEQSKVLLDRFKMLEAQMEEEHQALKFLLIKQTEIETKNMNDTRYQKSKVDIYIRVDKLCMDFDGHPTFSSRRRWAWWFCLWVLPASGETSKSGEIDSKKVVAGPF